MPSLVMRLLIVASAASQVVALRPAARIAVRCATTRVSVVRPKSRIVRKELDEATKKRREGMSDWEIYTDGRDAASGRSRRAKRGSDGVARAGEFGAAFKFPWEVEASDKTAIGHIIPVVVVLGLYAVPLAYGVASGNISF